MIFKSGGSTNLVGNLLGAGDGVYTSPLTPEAFGVRNTKDISHISVYYHPRTIMANPGNPSGDTSGPGGGNGLPVGEPPPTLDNGVPNSIPAPGVLGLMAAGLFGLAATRHRWKGRCRKI